ncbi:Aste57867_22061 [Aphanomyces stellatus]|uniref:Aste57867_22061 protein n=1 Tax=Aphanomyces stellatus TaxID=120398 RepID=A0A485LP56_9STRA|nr:hypothetical protein As57867_021992 [Aphanomyces stellatus]VFT98729.1 Aste57867_22061 [Aphanomyces stellatus]
MLQRLVGRSAAAAAALGLSTCLPMSTSTKAPTLDDELARIRVTEKETRERWIKDEDNWRQLPSRFWPAHQPPTSAQPGLEANVLTFCNKQLTSFDQDACRRTRFDLATVLVFNSIDPEAGFKLYESLAAEGDVDAIVATGVCLVEGFGVDQDYTRGVPYLHRASDLGHPQADFELATLFYTGAAAPALPASDDLALEYFERAMTNGRFSYATFMVADMLFDRGDASQYGRAMRLLYEAAEKGHRYARQEVLRLLKGEHRILKQVEAAKQPTK